MNVNGKRYRTIWLKRGSMAVQAIDQRKLPHEFAILDINTSADAAEAIRSMAVRGAGLIGAAAGYGMYLASLEAGTEPLDNYMKKAAEMLKETRPTAVNLKWAAERQLKAIGSGKTTRQKQAIALKTANDIANEDAEACKKIGEHGLRLLEEISGKKGSEINVMTHCNAGWLAFVDYGSATAPIYAAFDKGTKLHVLVKETRPRNQGASLTAWELLQHGVPHTIVVDNAAGHLMQQGKVDIVIVGTDRTTYKGNVANKIGTYMLALAAKASNVPFYVAVPSSSIDWETGSAAGIPIEERSENEVKEMQRLHEGGIKRVLLAPKESRALNYGFDVTPQELVTGLITERGICKANEKSISAMFPEKSGA